MTEQSASGSIGIRRDHASNAIPDSEIVIQVLAGDGAMYEHIMRRYNRLMFRLARSIVRDDDEARDVVQAAYVRAYYHLDQFRGPTGFRAWIARITINEACARVRRLPTFVDIDNILTVPDGSAAEPEKAAMTGEALRILEIAIDRLPDEFRSVFMLRGVEQLSILETAELLDIKPATVKTRFHRARRLLQRALHRKLYGLARHTYPFGGERCDQIVAAVYAELVLGSVHDTGGVPCPLTSSASLA